MKQRTSPTGRVPGTKVEIALSRGVKRVSQNHVERVIGLLATDEAVRRRFSSDPRRFLAEMMEKGMEFNECERWTLARLDPRELARFADAIGPRLQRIDREECDE